MVRAFSGRLLHGLVQKKQAWSDRITYTDTARSIGNGCLHVSMTPLGRCLEATGTFWKGKLP